MLISEGGKRQLLENAREQQMSHGASWVGRRWEEILVLIVMGTLDDTEMSPSAQHEPKLRRFVHQGLQIVKIKIMLFPAFVIWQL